MADTVISEDEKVQITAADAEKTTSVDYGKTAVITDVDEAFAAFEGNETLEVDEATSKRLLAKIDRRILPILCLVYGM
jgi:hypothetical protein